MSKRSRFSWMISPKSFIRLLGAEYDIMQKAGGKVLLQFYIAAIVVVIASAVCFVSVRYAIEMLFHTKVVEILLSSFFFLLFLFIYVFLINTFTKERSQNSFLNLSNITRAGFVLFMGFIMSKPLEVYYYSDRLDADVIKYQHKLKDEHTKRIEALFADDINNLEKLKLKYEQLNVGHSFDNAIQELSNKLHFLQEKMTNTIINSDSGIEGGSFFTYRVKRVCQYYPFSWVICLLVLCLFFLPTLLIYSISSDDIYFKMKKTYEKELILTTYQAFEERYVAFFWDKYQLRRSFYSKYEDAPFNTILKKGPFYKKATDFFTKYCPE